MSIRIRCDKCTKEGPTTDNWIEVIVTSQAKKSHNILPDVYQLCMKCSNDFDEYMKQKREPDLKEIKIGDIG